MAITQLFGDSGSDVITQRDLKKWKLKKPTKLDRLIFSGIIIVAIGWGVYYIYGQDSADVERATGTSERQRTIDNYISSYQIAKRNSKTDACTQAAMVAGLFLGLKDEASYRQWKTTEVSDCKEAGVNVLP